MDFTGIWWISCNWSSGGGILKKSSSLGFVMDCMQLSGKWAFFGIFQLSRTHVDLDQESNTHDNRLSPTIKCGIEGVTDNTTYVVFSGTSSSGYVVTTSRLNRCAHTHMRCYLHHHLPHQMTLPCNDTCQPDTAASRTWIECQLGMRSPAMPQKQWLGVP